MKLYKTKKNCGKLLLGILAFCTGMILLTGCGSSSEQKQNKNEETAEENKEEDKVQIGLTVDSFVIERWIRDRDVFVATARELGAEVNVQDAGADVKEQISQILQNYFRYNEEGKLEYEYSFRGALVYWKPMEQLS